MGSSTTCQPGIDSSVPGVKPCLLKTREVVGGIDGENEEAFIGSIKTKGCPIFLSEKVSQNKKWSLTVRFTLTRYKNQYHMSLRIRAT